MNAVVSVTEGKKSFVTSLSCVSFGSIIWKFKIRPTISYVWILEVWTRRTKENLL